MKLWNRKERKEEHELVTQTLDLHERQLDDLKTRLDNLQKRVDVIDPEGKPKTT